MNVYDKEYQKINSDLKEMCEQIISFSEKINEKIKKIHVKFSNEQPFSRTGFVSNEYYPAGVELYFDAIMPENDIPTLRFGLGMEKTIGEGIDQFFNLTIQFSVKQGSANELDNKNENYSTEDFRIMLLEESTKIINIVLSDSSIYDNNTEKASGKSYRLAISSTEIEYTKNGGISYDDNYDETLDAETIKIKIQTIMDEHLVL